MNNHQGGATVRGFTWPLRITHCHQYLEKYYSDPDDELLIATRYPALDSIRSVPQHPSWTSGRILPRSDWQIFLAIVPELR